jgi:Polyketide cyclase / dehydrase and lipid transport
MGRKSLFLLALSAAVLMGSYASRADDLAGALYKSPLPDTMNVRFVENHIGIDRPAKAVFDWVTTWGNLPKWLPVASGVKRVSGGPIEKPSHLGDVFIAVVPPKVAAAAGFKAEEFELQYTVVEWVDGFLWTVAGQEMNDGKPSDKIVSDATFGVQPRPDGSCVFSRLFQTIRPNVTNPAARRAVEDPATIQKGLEVLKEAIEREVPKG